MSLNYKATYEGQAEQEDAPSIGHEGIEYDQIPHTAKVVIKLAPLKLC